MSAEKIAIFSPSGIKCEATFLGFHHKTARLHIPMCGEYGYHMEKREFTNRKLQRLGWYMPNEVYNPLWRRYQHSRGNTKR